MEPFHQLLCKLHPPLLGGLTDLVADGVHDDAGVVIILSHHGLKVLPIATLEIVRVVVPVLMLIPHVPGLVHNVHAIPVAGSEQPLRGRVMGRAQGVEARLLQKPHPAAVVLLRRCRAQKAVVVVYAPAPQQGFPAVDKEPPCAPLHLSDAKKGLRRVSFFAPGGKRGPAGIELRRFLAPKLRPRQLYLSIPAGSPRDDLCAVQYLHQHFPSCGGGLHPDSGRVDIQGAHPKPLVLYMLPGPDYQLHRPIDAAAAVPAGVGQPAVVHLYLQGIVLPRQQPVRKLHVEGRIAVRVGAQDLPVKAYRAVSVHSPEVQQYRLVLPVGRAVKSLPVQVFPAGEKRVSGAARGFRVPCLVYHGVMGQGHLPGLAAGL